MRGQKHERGRVRESFLKRASSLRPHTPPPVSADGRHVAFGRVLTGLETVAKIGAVACIGMKPASPVTIRAAGPLPESAWAAVDAALAAQAKAAALAAGAAAPAAALSKASATGGAAKTYAAVPAPKSAAAAAPRTGEP